MAERQDNIIEDQGSISELLRSAERVAVLGIKTEKQAGQPAFYVPEYLKRVGYEIVPVPTYYPDTTEILGQTAYRSVSSVPEKVDLVIVFRRSVDVPSHVEDIIEAGPGAVWMQSGIRSAEAARRLADAGIKVVQDRCAMVEHQRLR